MSNPFLVDLEDSYTPYASGTHTPYSGAATPKRRNSTNPFEILSPENEDTTFLDNDAIRSSNEINNNGQSGGDVASAIADMTADFYQTISMKPYDYDEVFDDDNKVVEDSKQDEETKVKTVTTITYDNNGCDVFDPFETIHDDDGTVSSKRSSLDHQTVKSASDSANDDIVANVSKSAKAKELFNSSMASIELLAATSATPQQPVSSDFSPLSSTTPMSPGENAFLAAPQGMEIYSSDPSDLSDISPTNAYDPRSAFNIYSAIDKEEIPKFEPIISSDIIKRKISVSHDDEVDENDGFVGKASENKTGDSSEIAYFDPFTTVFNDSPTSEDVDCATAVRAFAEQEGIVDITTTQNEKSKAPSIDRRKLQEEVGGSVDLNDVGNPNINAIGIINDAFDELDKEPSEVPCPVGDSSAVDAEFNASIDIAEVESKNIQPNSLRQLVESELHQETLDEDNIAVGDDTIKPEEVNKSIEKNEDTKYEEDQPKDPFDTSAFDSKAFDAFESRFQAADSHQTSSVKQKDDPFASPYKSTKNVDNEKNVFDTFDPFIPKQPENTPFKVSKPKKKKDSFEDSDFDDDDDEEEEENLKIVIRAKKKETPQSGSEIPALAPPPLLPPPPKSPKHQIRREEEEEEEEEPYNEEDMILMSYKTPVRKNKTTAKSFIDDEFDRFFANSENRTGTEEAATGEEPEWPTAFGEAASKRTTGGDSPSSPQTPLYDEDTTQPLEDFPLRYLGEGWEMMLRHPAKKKLTANRYWKKVFVRFIPETCILQLFNKQGDPQPFQELPLQASYSISEISAQQYDQYGKIFTIKVQYIFYRERVGVRPGQIAKVMQGQIQSMGDFARLGMPVEHAPQVSELLKLGSLEYSDLKEFVTVVEEAMFRITVHRDRALTYRTEEIQCCVQDELYVEQNKIGIVEKQLARVRVFFLAFINGMPAIEVGINDMRRQGKEVVGRHDILPVVTEEWIRVEAPEFHSCVQADVFDNSQVVKLIPPDACHFELMRFRIRPPKNRELPLQVSANMNITPTKMELKCDVLVPGCISRKHGQIPCEDIQIRFHIPECWIYFFRVEKHFRYGAVHSTNRRSGKLKGFERILGTAANPEPQLIEVTAGQAKYEHAYHSIVWRIPRLPKEGQGAYTQQLLLVRLPLSSFDRIPESFYDYVHVEFHMPSTTVSHTTLRSISVNSENPPEKFVRYLAKYEYKICLNITYDDTKVESEYSTAASINNGSVKNIDQEAHSSEEEAENNDDEDMK